VNLHAPLRQQFGSRNQMGPGSLELHAQRNDVRMLEQQKQIGHAARAPFFDERALQMIGLGVWHDAEVTNFKGTH
jgi:hypothetical protein